MFCNSAPAHSDARTLPAALSCFYQRIFCALTLLYELVIQAENAKIKVIGQNSIL